MAIRNACIDAHFPRLRAGLSGFATSALALSIVVHANGFAQDDPTGRTAGQRSEKVLAQKRADLLAKGLTVGTCEQGVASKDLDVNNVRARLYNTGANFYRGGDPTYTVPRSGGVEAVFAAGLWFVGRVEGALAMFGAEYFDWELWPGPLDANGSPPVDCSQYDRMYKVNRQDILDYEDGKPATSDLREWPAHLGAPVIDGDGNPDNYDLAAGDRPEVLGDQTIWWVMNDAGNVHQYYGTRPLGVEVQVTAFAFKTADALNNTTFYRYRFINKSGGDITDARLSVWVDPELGNGFDDYGGVDTTLSLGFVWNSDNDDQGFYGENPPAIGFDFFQGPIADPDGVDNDRDGEIDEEGETLPMTSFVVYLQGEGPNGDPESVEQAYNYQTGRWKDNVPITFGGNGRGSGEKLAPFMYPADPGEYWSESNNDGEGTRNEPFDRRLLMTSGPFTMPHGASQTIIYGIVWSRGTDNLDSVRKLKADDRLAQDAFDIGFQLPAPPDAPRVEVSELDESVIIKWGYRPSDNNYLDQYEIENPILNNQEYDDKTYSFEGYNVLQFESETDDTGKVVATFDVVNSVTRVFDLGDVDIVTGTLIPVMSADGTDSGVQHSFQIDELVNYRDYHFGVQAYGYNAHSSPKVLKSAVSRVVVKPSKQLARLGGTVINDEARDAEFTIESGLVTKEGKGGGSVSARVIDPSVLTGHVYRVEFFEDEPPGMSEEPTLLTNYSIVDATANTVLFNGHDAMSSFGHVAPQTPDVLQADGLSWTIVGPEPDVLRLGANPCPECPAFVQVEGIGEGDACGAGAISRFGCNQVGGNNVYEGSLNGAGDWTMDSPDDGPETSIADFAPDDFEIRATEAGSYGYHYFTEGNAIWVPFEVWDVGPVGPHGVNDPSDDVQMIPVLFSDNGGECFFGFGELETDPFGYGWPGTDRIYAYYAVDNDYASWETAIKPLVDASADGCARPPDTDGPSELIEYTGRIRPIQRIVFYMDPESPNYRDAFIPVGNVIRFLTTKPNTPGDVFTVDTEGYGVRHDDQNALKQALDLIAVVPNPYKGASEYEISNLADVVRFTNLPQELTIRIFTLAGTLIKTIQKNSASTSVEWDLRTDENLPIGSGMYLIHVEVPGVGEKIIKFGAVKKRAHLELY